MAYDFSNLNSSNLETFGIDATFIPDDTNAPEDVRVINVDPAAAGAIPSLRMVFGTVTDSPFSRVPAKNDRFEIDDETYSVFEVIGPDVVGGIYISLTK